MSKSVSKEKDAVYQAEFNVPRFSIIIIIILCFIIII